MGLSHKEIGYEAIKDAFGTHVPANIDQEDFKESVEGAVEALEDIVHEYTDGNVTLFDIIS